MSEAELLRWKRRQKNVVSLRWHVLYLFSARSWAGTEEMARMKYFDS